MFGIRLPRLTLVQIGSVADFVRHYEPTHPILLEPSLEKLCRLSPQFGLPQHYFVDPDVDRGQ